MTMESILYIGGLLFSTGATIAVFKFRIDRLERDLREDNEQHDTEHRNLWKVLGDIRRAVDEHDKDSTHIRLEIERRLGAHDSSINVTRAQYDEIIRRLDDIDKKMDKME